MFHEACEQSHETVSINHIFSRERRAEADRNEVLLLTSQAAYVLPYAFGAVRTKWKEHTPLGVDTVHVLV